MDSKELNSLCVKPDFTILQTILAIDLGRHGIALVIDDDRRLLGTVTDGDIRRAILAAVNLEQPVEILLTRKANQRYRTPTTAPVDASRERVLRIMGEHQLRQIPLINKDNQVVDLVTLDDLLPNVDLPMQAVIMAGGFGKRLHPLTENLPKPMLPVGGQPIMERIVRQLQQAGIKDLNIATYYKADIIKNHFGDGSAYGVNIQYVTEEQPLGTGGALGLLARPQEPILVINGDILTQIDFRVMLQYHQDNHADLTIAVRNYEVLVPYGVVELENARVLGLKEKPRLNFFVNAGIYILNPTVYDFIPIGEHFNITDLITWLLEAKRTVVSFPIREYWLDIGQLQDYQQAQTDVSNGDFEK